VVKGSGLPWGGTLWSVTWKHCGFAFAEQQLQTVFVRLDCNPPGSLCATSLRQRHAVLDQAKWPARQSTMYRAASGILSRCTGPRCTFLCSGLDAGIGLTCTVITWTVLWWHGLFAGSAIVPASNHLRVPPRSASGSGVLHLMTPLSHQAHVER